MIRVTPILPTDNLRISKAFYVDKLGFSLRFEYTEDGEQGLVGIERGNVHITLDCPMEGHGREACVSIEVEDTDAIFEEWASQLELTDRPKNEDWGARTFSIQDPSGNTLFIIGPLS
jgi:catechol 2,3-dioxygenase-like lactoylglutathione lyase family enzyme